jgi:exocyst complex component 1
VDRRLAEHGRLGAEARPTVSPLLLKHFQVKLTLYSQTVGLLYTIERKQANFEETSQEFLLRTLQKVHISLGTSFTKFVEEQIRGIEETKVKIKKRKGVIAFIKTFPHFSIAIENMLPTPEPNSETMEVRYMINDAYTKINRAMWESLNFIAKESPAGGQASGSGDPEDKEALNYHILLIENMNHYVEEVEGRNNIVLEEWRDKAAHDMGEHLKLYLDAVIRRPLGKLLDFIESVESLLSTVNPPSNIATRASHSRSTAKKVFSAYDSKEIRRGIETLKKRVEKHFGDADDPGLSRSLVSKVLRELESRYGLVWERATRISEVVYENSLEVEWKREELAIAFRR